MPKRSTLLALLALLLVTALLPAPALARDLPGTATPSLGSPSDTLTSYQLTVTLATETRQLTGSESIVWQNTTGQHQNTIYLRLYPNAEYYGEAQTTVDNITVDGEPVTPSSGDDPTVLAIPLGRTVAAGDQATIALDFTTLVPLGSAGSFGIFQLDPETSVWSLADWYPIVAGWEASKGDWYLARPTAFGDPTFSEIATYDLTLTMPEGLEMVSSGSTESLGPAGDGAITQAVTTGPARDFAMTLLPTARDQFGANDNVVQTERTVDGVRASGDEPFTIRLTLLADEAIPGLADAILADVAATLPVYAGWLGNLPEDELDITTASLAGANGVSWSGLIWIDPGTIVADGVFSDQERMGLRFVLAHEIGHQWIGGLIGSNSNDHGFMTEGLTNALAVEVLRELEGNDAAAAYLQGYVAGGYAALVRDGRDVVADTPVTDEMNGVLRGLAVYGKAALGFEAIRQELGDKTYRDAIAGYAHTFRFGIATPDDLRKALTGAGPSVDEVNALWHFWFEEDTATITDVEAVFAGAAT